MTIIIGLFIGLKLGEYFSVKKKEFHSQIITSIKPIAKISTYKIHKIEEIQWTNQSNNQEGINYIVSKIANLLYSKTLHISIPVTATYGLDLDSTNWYFKTNRDTIFMYIPQPKLLNFEIKWNEKKVVSEKGLLSFENDRQFDDLEKMFYRQKIAFYAQNDTALKKSKEIFENRIVKFYKNLGYNVVIRAFIFYDNSDSSHCL